MLTSTFNRYQFGGLILILYLRASLMQSSKMRAWTGSQAPPLLSCSRTHRHAARCRQTTSAALDEHSRRQRQNIASPARVLAPTAESATSSSEDERQAGNAAEDSRLAGMPSWPTPVDIADVTRPVADDVTAMNKRLRDIVANRHPRLQSAADQIFGAGGKKLRPVLVFLVARATGQLTGLSDLTEKQRNLAEIIEMIHTASLVHDDVIDEAGTRRGRPTVNRTFGNRTAVLVGDFLFAQSSYLLAHLENNEVIKLISQVIADFADGEINQSDSLFDTETTLEKYLDKSFYKTASLIASSCKSSAIFSGVDEDVKDAMFRYGKHLGLAFQVVDDILDFTRTSEQLGKPQGQDLASGNLTAPVLYTLHHETAGPELLALIDSDFTDEGGLARAIELVTTSGGIEKAQQLARSEADKGLQALVCLPESDAKLSLQLFGSYVLERLF